MTAFKVRHIGCRRLCCMKAIAKDAPPQVKAHFEQEINIMSQLSHPFIADFFEDFETDRDLLLVTELATGHSLHHALQENRKFSESEALRIFSQLVCVISYLHETEHIVHRDLKLENILLDANKNVKLIDFGYAAEFSDDKHEFTESIGSPAYVAPEIAQGHSYTQLVDIWSMGIVLFALVTGHLPFTASTTEALLQKIVLTDPGVPDDLSPDLSDILQRLLTKDPAQRINIAGVRQHPWLRKASPRFTTLPMRIYTEMISQNPDTDVATDITTHNEISAKIHEAMHSQHQENSAQTHNSETALEKRALTVT